MKVNAASFVIKRIAALVEWARLILTEFPADGLPGGLMEMPPCVGISPEFLPDRFGVASW